MTTINAAYIDALLADASYIDGLRNATLKDQLVGSMTPALAEYIAANFTVVQQVGGFASSFEATVWRGNTGTPYAGQVYVSMRGTQEAPDYVADGDLASSGLAHRQLVDMVNWWLRETTPERYDDGTPRQATQIALSADNDFYASASVMATGKLADIVGIQSVNGHSLGGYLATAFGRIFGGKWPINSVNTFNSAGFSRLAAANIENGFGQIALLIGSTFGREGGFSTAQNNYFGSNGINVTTNTWDPVGFQQYGTRIELFQEDSGGFSNHSMYKLTDLLALGNALAQLDSTLDFAKLFALAKAGSNQMAASYEGVLDATRRLLMGASVPGTPPGDANAGSPGPQPRARIDFQANLKALIDSSAFRNLVDKVTITSVDSNVGSQAKARVGFEEIIALRTLSPFVVSAVGADGANALAALWQSAAWGTEYQAWISDKALRQTGGEASAFTDSWIDDRSLLLKEVLQINTADNTSGIVSDATMPTDRVLELRYFDEGLQQTKTVVVWNPANNGAGNGLTSRPHQIISFGSEGNDTITGNAIATLGDHLYGGGGIDTVNGLAGDDYLEGNDGSDLLDGGTGVDTLLGGGGDDTLIGGEGHDLLLGGSGNDKYYFEGNFGLDIIRDSDGVGKIVVGAPGFTPLSGGNKFADNIYLSDDKQFTYTLIEGNLTIRPVSTGATHGFITVNGWKPGELGITLSDTQVPQAATTTSYIGDFAKKKNPDGTQYLLGEDGQYVADGAQANATDLIAGTGGPDLIQGLGGDDALAGKDGDDIIEGGDGNDVIMGGGGADILRGGAGRDLIYGSSNGSLQYPTATSYQLAESSYPVLLGEGFDWRLSSPGPDADGFQHGFLSSTVTRDTQAGDQANIVDGGSGDDIIYAGTGNDAVHGGLDNDQIMGMAGDDVVFGDDGSDRIYGDGPTSNAEALVYTAGNQHGSDILFGGKGNDLLIGQGGDDVLYGGDDNDVLYGDDREDASLRGDDYLDGGAGNDFLASGAGDDILIGGTGNDTLVGGAGRDIYIFNRGEGRDTVYDDKADNNVFRFGTGVTSADITLRLGSLMLDLGGGDEIHIEGFDTQAALDSSSIDSFEFADGSALSVAELMERGFDIDGTAQADNLVGTSVDDRIKGLAGADVINGMAGDDTLDGGDGDDVLSGGQGNDLLIGGGGNDTLFADAGDDTLVGGEGNDAYVIQAGVGHVTVTDTSGTNIVALDSGLGALSGGSVDSQAMVLTFKNGSSVTVQSDALYQFGNGPVIDSEAMAILIRNAQTPAPTPGTTVTNLVDANGHVVGSSVKTIDVQGNTIITTFSGADGTGARLNDSWTTAVGRHGTDTFGSDGSSSGVMFCVDGTSISYVDDGNGDRTQIAFSAHGVKTGDSWTQASGTFGSDVFNSNGSSSGITQHADGSYTTYTDDGHGHRQTTEYDAHGQPIPTISETTFADGDYRTTVNDGLGGVTSTLFSASGVKLSDSWSKPDGTHGSHAFSADGSSAGVIYEASGAYSTTANDGQGQTITKNYTWQGNLTGSSVTEINGLNSITAKLDAAGVKVTENWTHPDGSAGTDLVGPLDYDGLANLVTQHAIFEKRGNASWSDGLSGGAGGYFQFSASGGFGDDWWVPASAAAIEEAHQAGYTYARQPTGWSSVWEEADGSVDEVFARTYPARYAGIELCNMYNGGSGGTIAWADLFDAKTGVSFHGTESQDGTKYLYADRYIVGRGLVHSEMKVGQTPQTPLILTFEGDDGRYSSFSDDGQGNAIEVGYDANGVKLDDLWYHNDGSNGSDIFNTDGSSAGLSANPDGTIVTYAKDSQGHVVMTNYPGPYSLVPVIYHAPEDVTPTPSPGPHSPPPPAPAPGTPYTTSYSDGHGGTVTVTLSQGDTTAYHTDTLGNTSKVDTDPGYGANVAVNGNILGWNYDAAGIATSRFVADGHGGVVTYFYDSRGGIAAHSAATTDSDGTVTIQKYDAAGQLAGSSVRTSPSAGQTNTNNYDAAGRLTGHIEELSNGDRNSITSNYDAAGALISLTAKVATGPAETTITSYDAQGAATGVIVTTTNDQGVISTNNYDGGGHLTGSVVATPDSVGNINTANYDAAGALTSYVTLTTDDQNDTVLCAYNAQGVKLHEDLVKPDGIQVSTRYSPDGSSLATTVAPDGSFSTLTRNSVGDVTIAQYNAQGAKLTDSWTRGDGSSGCDTFHLDGTSTGSALYADGTTSSSINDASGQVTTTHYAVGGAVTGSTVTTHSQSETRTVQYDASGHAISDTWMGVDGSSGTDTWNADGSVSGTRINADGSSSLGTGNPPGANHAPVLAQPVADQSAVQGGAWTFTVPAATFSDADTGDTLTYSASLADGAALPGWIQFDAATRTFSGTPHNADVGGLSLGITATDAHGLSASSAFALSVANINDAPTVAQAIAEQSVNEDQVWSFTVPAATFADVDVGDSLTYAATLANGSALPAWLNFNAATRTFSGTPLNGDVGSISLKVTATDTTGAAVTDSFDLTMANTNDSPVVAQPVSGQSATEDQAWSFTVPANTFADEDLGDALTYSADLADGSTLPAWLRFNAATRTFSGTPLNGDVGSVSVKVVATDAAGAAASTNFSLNVANINDAPTVAQVIGSQGAMQDQLWSYTVPAATFADVDAGDTLSYAAILASGGALPTWLSFNANTGTFSGTPHNSDVGSLDLKIVATDSTGASANAAFTLRVANVNDAPVAVGTLEGWAAMAGTVVTYTVPASAFDDIDAGDKLTYSATLANGAALPSWVSFDAATRSFSGTPTANDGGDFALRVIATDSGGLTAYQSVALHVDTGLTLSGTGGADTLIGGTGNDYLNGLAGADQMRGGQGDDTYVVDNIGDVVIENANEGFDTVNASITYTLPANAERLVLTGTSPINGTGNGLGNVLIGNAANNQLTGGAGNDTLDGRAGDDNMKGGTGDDSYCVDSAHDVVTELANEGTDTVLAAVTYTLASNVENLVLTGTAVINATGNPLANVLTGNAGDNDLRGGDGDDTLYGGAGDDTLNGEKGNDSMIGGTGDDWYFVSEAGDIVVELANEGIDTVTASFSYTLSANLENLVLGGGGSIDGTGNSLDNVLTGNGGNNKLVGGAGNDTLDGAGGADTLTGGTGDDVYVVNNDKDVVIENSGEGMDTVRSSINFTLSANVENLTMTGGGGANGTGNELDNVLTGNSAGNHLTGNAGNDYMDGGAGPDVLAGGTGNDRYVMARGYGSDTIVENDAAAGNADVALFGPNIDDDQLWFRRSGPDSLEVMVIGTPDAFVIQHWFLGNQYHVEQFKTSDGKTLLDSQVQNLVDAMASFKPPAAGQTTLPPNYQGALGTVIAANWQ